MVGPREGRWVRAGFLAGALFLVGQFALTLTFREHYPAMVLPAGRSKVHHGRVPTITRYELTAETQAGDARTVDPHEILADVPSHVRSWVLARRFGLDRPQPDPVSIRWLRSRVESRVGTPVRMLRVEQVRRPIRPQDSELEAEVLKTWSIPLAGDGHD
ncbi:MAG: hypothetical protein AAGD10_03505 [Myxococcota bacterium]